MRPDLTLYKSMLFIRVFEEAVGNSIEDGFINTPCHLCIGQEAISAGIAINLQKQDIIWGNHRSHGHYLAKGGNPSALMDEIFCKETGCSKGRGGSMHIIDKDAGILGTVPIVAGTIPLAVGSAIALKGKNQKNISVSFFGDGATEEGHVIESMNMANLYDLPVLFVIENNLYSSHMPMNLRRKQEDLQKIGEMLGIRTQRLDGNDVRLIQDESSKVIDEIRNQNKPQIIELMTYRWRGHVGPKWDEDVGVKRKDELSEWLPKDPIKKEKKYLIDSGVSLSELDKLKNELEEEVTKLVSDAKASFFPSPATILDHRFF